MTEFLNIEKFRYNQINNQLGVLPKGKEWEEVKNKEMAKYHGGNGAIDPYNKNHGINTVIRVERIDAFYKLVAGEQVIYYKKHLPRLDEQEFFFDIGDIIERNAETQKGEYKYKQKQDFSKG